MFLVGHIEGNLLFVMDTPTHKHLIIVWSQIQVNRYFCSLERWLCACVCVCVGHVLTIDAIHKRCIPYVCMPLRLVKQVSGIFAEGIGVFFFYKQTRRRTVKETEEKEALYLRARGKLSWQWQMRNPPFFPSHDHLSFLHTYTHCIVITLFCAEVFRVISELNLSTYLGYSHCPRDNESTSKVLQEQPLHHHPHGTLQQIKLLINSFHYKHHQHKIHLIVIEII